MDKQTKSDNKIKKNKGIILLASIAGKDPIITHLDNEDQAKILQAELNNLYGRNQVRTKFIFKD